MKFDDISWHTGAENFPKDRPDSAAATHSGMFLFWCFQKGLTSEIHNTEELKNKSITPSKYFIQACDGKLTDEDFNEEGVDFAHYCFESASENSYLSAYECIVTSDPHGHSNAYNAPDDWTNFAEISRQINELYESFTRNEYKSPLTKFSSALATVEEYVKKHKYRFSKKNTTATKRLKGYTIRVYFAGRRECSEMNLVAFISSPKYKEWRIQNNRGESDVIQSFGLCKEFLRAESIKLDPPILPSLKKCISDGLETYINELIELPEKISERIIKQQSFDDDFDHNFDFLLHYQGLEQARAYCVNYFQENIGVYYEYKNVYSYREDYLEKAPDGLGKDLAIISRKYNFGDLSQDVTPE